MARHSILNRRLRIEPLEPRQLLCSGMTGSSSLQTTSQIATLAKSHSAAVVSGATAKSTSSGTSDQTTDSYLVATLTNSSGVVVGTASYETDTDGTNTAQKLVISVIGAAANASYSVTVGATNLGTLMTDANGNGRMVLTSNGSSSSSDSATNSAACRNGGSGTTTTGILPTNFTLAAGVAIALASTDTTVDSLNGTFATSTGDIGVGNGFGNVGVGSGHGCHGSGETSVSRLEASLTNGTTSVGRAVFSTYTDSDGTTTDILRVHLKGADASAALDVSVDGTSVGSITTDANGNGILILSSSPKSSNVGQLPSGFTATSSSTIAVGTSITGSFSSATSSSYSGKITSSIGSSYRSFSLRRR